MTAAQATLSSLRFDEAGLVPAVIQDAETGAVLMLGFMNAEALRLTRETGRVHYWSRSRGRIWRKGETSGHEQVVDELFVNCELNTLLITVHQVGAVCHDGYPTCFYRRVEDDGALTVVRDRWFDPEDVYGPGAEPASPEHDVGALTRRWLGAYEFLRDRDLTAVSSTSRRLRSSDEPLGARIADELRELAGVLTGTHRHGATDADIVLEGAQVLYWIALVAVRERIGWDRLRPDRALATNLDELAASAIATLLQRDAETWAASAGAGDLAARCHATIALVGQACRVAGVPPASLLLTDLAELEEKPYLSEYFAAGR